MFALAAITATAGVSVLAQNSFARLPGAQWLMASMSSLNSVSIVAASAPVVHDGDHYPTSGTFIDTLTNAQVSQHQDGDTVVVMSATGELPGTLTVKLTRDGTGTTITGGEWAFNVAYTKEVDNEDGTHSEVLVQRGTLKGTIAGGQAVLGSDGAVSSVTNLQLVVDGGTLTFHARSTGSGVSNQADLNSPADATGGLTLTF